MTTAERTTGANLENAGFLETGRQVRNHYAVERMSWRHIARDLSPVYIYPNSAEGGISTKPKTQKHKGRDRGLKAKSRMKEWAWRTARRGGN